MQCYSVCISIAVSTVMTCAALTTTCGHPNATVLIMTSWIVSMRPDSGFGDETLIKLFFRWIMWTKIGEVARIYSIFRVISHVNWNLCGSPPPEHLPTFSQCRCHRPRLTGKEKTSGPVELASWGHNRVTMATAVQHSVKTISIRHNAALPCLPPAQQKKCSVTIKVKVHGDCSSFSCLHLQPLHPKLVKKVVFLEIFTFFAHLR